MKLPILLSIALLGASAPARSEVSPIRMTVEQVSKNPIKAKEPWSKTQIRSLTIHLLNNSANPYPELVVKYWFFGRDMTGNDITILQQGERKSAITPRGKDTVESETFSTTYIEAHTEGGKAPKKVPASGNRVMGYAVQLLDGTKVMAETYSEPSYKQRLADAPAPAPAPAAAPKKK